MMNSLWAVCHNMDWDGGGQNISQHWTEEGAYCAMVALEAEEGNRKGDYHIEEQEIVD